MLYTQPIQLGTRTLKNRMLMAPVKTAYGTPQGGVTQRHLAYYANIARGGAGMIILEPVAVTQTGKEHPKQLTIHLEHSVDDLRRIVGVIHANGSLACLNLNHAGRAANPKATGGPPLAPSPLACPTTAQTPRQLTADQIEEILAGYRSAVRRTREAGFDAVEIQCGHGYLVSQFLSPRTNTRDDEWGADRTLFLRRVLEIVQQERGELTVLVRISGSEFVQGGLGPADNQVILDAAAAGGVDAIHCGMGNACDSPPWYYAHMAIPEEQQLEALRAIRGMTSLPLIAAGRMADLDKLARLEAEKIADMVAFGRALVADPNLPARLSAGKEREITWCGFCLQGCLSHVKDGTGLGCIVNPEIDKEPLEPTTRPRKVAVVGSGPAGLSAACTLARRGHAVTLFERESELGGQFRLAPRAPHKEKMSRPLDGLISRARREVADIRLHTPFAPAQAAGYEAVIVATGSRQHLADIPNLDSQYWMSSLEFFRDQRQVQGPRVLIIGAGMVGMEAAELLLARGFQVTATKRSDTIANDMEPITKKMMLARVGENSNLTLMPETTVLEFSPQGARVRSKGEEKTLPPFDTVILASGMEPEDAIVEELENTGIHPIVVGDAAKPADIYAATQAGYRAAAEIA